MIPYNYEFRKSQDLEKGCEYYNVDGYDSYDIFYKVDYTCESVSVMIELPDDQCYREGCEEHDCELDIDCDFDFTFFIEMHLDFEKINLDNVDDLLLHIVSNYGIAELLNEYEDRFSDWYVTNDQTLSNAEVYDARLDYMKRD